MLLKSGRQMLDQPGATQDDVLPVGSEELFMESVGRESKLLFNRRLPVAPVFWPPVDQNAIHI